MTKSTLRGTSRYLTDEEAQIVKNRGRQNEQARLLGITNPRMSQVVNQKRRLEEVVISRLMNLSTSADPLIRRVDEEMLAIDQQIETLRKKKDSLLVVRNILLGTPA